MPVSARALVTLAEARDWLNLAASNTVEDAELERVIDDISDRFHREARREFKVSGTNPQTRLFEVEPLGRRQPIYVDGDYRGDRNRWARTVRVGDLTSFTSVSVIDTDWTTTLESVTLSKVTGHPMVREPWEPIRELEFSSAVTALSAGMRVSVTGSFGFPSVPPSVRQAVLEGIAAAVDRDVEHYRQDMMPTSAGSTAAGTTVYVGGGRQRLLSLPPSVLAVAWDYRDTSIG